MEEESVAPQRGRAAAWVGAGALVLIVGAWISMPGVDTEVLDSARGVAGLSGATMPLLPLIGLSMAPLLIVRIIVALIGSSSALARTLAFVSYLIVAGLQALSIALWAEAANDALFDLVPEPGWGFRVKAVLSCVAGAAVLYWIADRIDATRAATGALALGLIAALITLVHDAGSVGQQIASTSHTPLSALPIFALPLTLAALAIGLALRTPRWPIRVARALELRSGVDVLGAPAVLAFLLGSFLGGELFGVVGLPKALVVVVAGCALALFLFVRVKERAPRRALVPLVVAVVSFALVAVPMSAELAGSDFLARSSEPGPLAGQESFLVTLAAEDRFVDGEAERMVRRLSALGAAAELLRADPESIMLMVRDARDSESVLDALRPHTLELRLVTDFPPGLELPPGVRIESPDEGLSGSCEALRAVEPGCTSALEPIVESDEPAFEARCRLYCLEATPIVTGADIQDARVASDPISGRPRVSATLERAAAERFGRATGDNIGRKLAIVLDGEIVSAPIISGAIRGGVFEISLGGAAPDEASFQAQLLVSALRTNGEITSAWTLVSLTHAAQP